MTTPYDPTATVPEAAWYRLNSRKGSFYILIDATDLDLIASRSPWSRDWQKAANDPDGGNRTWSARKGVLINGQNRTVRLHRWLLGLQDIDTGENLAPGLHADHISGRRWDNRRLNLRSATPSESTDNTAPQRRQTSSGERNIANYVNRVGTAYWLVQLQRNGRFVYRRAFRQDAYTLSDVVEIRDREYEALWGRPRLR